MNLRVEVNGEALILDAASHQAWIEEVMPGVFSILIRDRSFRVNVAPGQDGLEVWVGLERYLISIADPRDKASGRQKTGAGGPIEIRAQMPGKIIQLLAQAGDAILAGQGLMVVEAMKMQNEVKAPKAGRLTRVFVSEGSTVGAGEPMLVIE